MAEEVAALPPVPSHHRSGVSAAFVALPKKGAGMSVQPLRNESVFVVCSGGCHCHLAPLPAARLSSFVAQEELAVEEEQQLVQLSYLVGGACADT